MYTEGHQGEVDQVKLPAAWGTTTGDSAVKIAVLDTGVTKKGDLEGAVLGGYNYVSNTGNTDDDFGHGTTVASLIAARGNNGEGMAGACWSCDDHPGQGARQERQRLRQQRRQGHRLRDQRRREDHQHVARRHRRPAQVLADAVAYANLKGVLVVAAAGNAVADHEPATPSSTRRRYPDVVVGRRHRPRLRRPRRLLQLQQARRLWVDIAAPGVVAGMDRLRQLPHRPARHLVRGADGRRCGRPDQDRCTPTTPAGRCSGRCSSRPVRSAPPAGRSTACSTPRRR